MYALVRFGSGIPEHFGRSVVILCYNCVGEKEICSYTFPALRGNFRVCLLAVQIHGN
jgi:hypothetical protein